MLPARVLARVRAGSCASKGGAGRDGGRRGGLIYFDCLSLSLSLAPILSINVRYQFTYLVPERALIRRWISVSRKTFPQFNLKLTAMAK